MARGRSCKRSSAVNGARARVARIHIHEGVADDWRMSLRFDATAFRTAFPTPGRPYLRQGHPCCPPFERRNSRPAPAFTQRVQHLRDESSPCRSSRWMRRACCRRGCQNVGVDFAHLSLWGRGRCLLCMPPGHIDARRRLPRLPVQVECLNMMYHREWRSIRNLFAPFLAYDARTGT